MSSFKYNLLSEFHKTLQAAFGSPSAKYFTTSAYWPPLTLSFVPEGYLTLTWQLQRRYYQYMQFQAIELQEIRETRYKMFAKVTLKVQFKTAGIVLKDTDVNFFQRSCTSKTSYKTRELRRKL